MRDVTEKTISGIFAIGMCAIVIAIMFTAVTNPTLIVPNTIEKFKTYQSR